MSATLGCQSMIDPIRQVLVKRPEEAFAVADPQAWNYSSRPDFERARAEHDALVEVLRQAGAEVVYHDEEQPGRADAIFVFDPALLTDRGAVMLQMGKALRRGEEEVLRRRLENLGVPILFSLEGEARAEGGDLLWVDENTLAVGLGFRTNAAAWRQLRDGLAAAGVEVVAVELPYFTGPRACLHLLSLLSIVDRRTAVIYPPLVSVPFWQLLEARGFRLVEVPEHEFHSMATNVLAMAPGKCLMLEGNPITRRLLEEAGCEVHTYRGEELSLKAEGGPTCLTRPLRRSP